MNTGSFTELTGKLGQARARITMLIGMAALLVLAAAVIGNVLSGAAAASDFEIESSHASSDSEDAEPVVENVFVHVSGAVANPGLYELKAGSRVADAVNAAGGFTDEADEGSCNLARIIEDGEHIIIPNITEGVPVENGNPGALAIEEPSNAGPLNVNTATADQLESLPGIGASTARKIVSDREANGPYSSTEDLKRVSGIGDKKLSALEGLICV